MNCYESKNIMFINDLVSIVMPTYNSGKYIINSIESVLSQSYQNWQLFIVDDYSTDNTLNIILTFKDPRIILIKNDSNKGVVFTRNRAIQAAKGQFIAFLDSDDLWLPNKLSQQVAALRQQNNAVCCHSSFRRIDESGKFINDVRTVKHINLSLMRKSNFIGNSTGIIDRNKVGTVFQKERKHEDYIMWLDVLSKTEEAYSIGIEEVLAEYRVRSSSLSSNKVQSLNWHWSILRKEQELSIFSSVYYLCHYVYFGIKKRT